MFMRLALRRSRALIAISEFTKQEAISLFGIDPKKITVTPLGVDSSIYKPQRLSQTEKNRLIRKYKITDEFILCLATIEPRKNMVAVIESFRRIKPQFPNLKLVLAGGKGWHALPITNQAGEDVIFTGYVDKQDKPALYSLSKAFVFPSVYEGFGLPPLEAMACGTPTIVSNRASLPEVAGRIALQVELEYQEQLDQALVRCLNWTSEQRRSWSRSAVDWAHSFSWEKTAQDTATILTKFS